jgi:hypothetical protein
LFRGVVTGLVTLGPGKNAQECWITVRDPLTECESAYEDRYSGDNGIEKIESANCTNANEVKQGAFDTQVSEGLMQALEDSVCPSCLRLHVCHTPLSVLAVMGG